MLWRPLLDCAEEASNAHTASHHDPERGSLVALVAALILVAAPGALGIGIFLASALLLVALVTALVAWIMGMLTAADQKRWGWFVAAPCLGAIGSLAYGLAQPEGKSASTILGRSGERLPNCAPFVTNFPRHDHVHCGHPRT
jgi:hypothetical protein